MNYIQKLILTTLFTGSFTLFMAFMNIVNPDIIAETAMICGLFITSILMFSALVLMFVQTLNKVEMALYKGVLVGALLFGLLPYFATYLAGI